MSYKCAKCSGEVSATEARRAREDESYMPYCDICAGTAEGIIGISWLSETAQRKAEKMAEDTDRPVYAKRYGRGWRLAQVHFVDMRSDQYQKDAARLLKDGWAEVVND